MEYAAAKYQDQNEAQSRAGIPWRNAEAGVGLEEADPVERHKDSGTAARSNRMSACLRASILTFF